MEIDILDDPAVDNPRVLRIRHVDDREPGPLTRLRDVNVRPRQLLLHLHVGDPEEPAEWHVRRDFQVFAAADLGSLAHVRCGGPREALRKQLWRRGDQECRHREGAE